mmetsp:Transcript_9006/g.21388  ORF Transcript_9006/g.21388 Transcript_9006/m.21388 type:complete len:347 (+) Transcript_9006:311-1351(+)
MQCGQCPGGLDIRQWPGGPRLKCPLSSNSGSPACSYKASSTWSRFTSNSRFLKSRIASRTEFSNRSGPHARTQVCRSIAACCISRPTSSRPNVTCSGGCSLLDCDKLTCISAPCSLSIGSRALLLMRAPVLRTLPIKPIATLETVMQESVVNKGTSRCHVAYSMRLPNGPSCSKTLSASFLDAIAAATISTNGSTHEAKVSSQRASERWDGGPVSASLDSPAVAYSLAAASPRTLTNTQTLATPAKDWRSMALARLRYSSPLTAQSRDTAAQGAVPFARSSQSKSKNGTMPTPPATRSIVHCDGGACAWLGLPKGPSMSIRRGEPEDAATHSDLDHSPTPFTTKWA